VTAVTSARPLDLHHAHVWGPVSVTPHTSVVRLSRAARVTLRDGSEPAAN